MPVPTTRADLRNELRNLLHIWPDSDAIQATDMLIGATTLTVVDADRAPAGAWLEIQEEVMRVRTSDENTNILTVRRGDKGTVAAQHDQDEAVLIHGPHEPSNKELNDYLRDAINWLYPVAALDMWDTSLDTETGVLNYTIPNPIEQLAEMYLEDSTAANGFRRLRQWNIVGEDVWFPWELPSLRTLQFHGYGRFTLPQGDGDELDLGSDLFQAVKLYAAGLIVKGQESVRTRFTGQSALLESRSGNIADLIGSSREFFRQAELIRNKSAEARPFQLRAVTRRA